MALAGKATVGLCWLAMAAIAAVLAALVAGLAMVVSVPAKSTPSPAHALTQSRVLDEMPAALQAAASATLGGAQARYRLTAVAHGFRGVNPEQGLRLRSAPLGIDVTSSDGTELRLTLASALAGGSPLALPAATPRIERNRAVYDAGDVQQSFVDGPLGVEQRFVVRRATVLSASSVTLLLDVSGVAPASLSPDGRDAILSGRRGPVFRYEGLAATDASGRSLAARMRLRRGQLSLELQTRAARFPITVDPLLSAYAVLTGPAGQTSAFGSSVALSNDGSTAAIGGESDDGGVGAVWVFTRSGASWAQQGPKLTPHGANRLTRSRGVANFGATVSISGNGNTIIVGDGRFSAMAAWVIVRSNGAWHQQGPPLSPRVPSGYVSGSEAVAISGDGRTAVFGGTASNVPLTWVYVWSHGHWNQQGRALEALNAHPALSANGNTLLIGTASYSRHGSRWRSAGSIAPGPGSGGFPRAALSADGLTAVITNRGHGYALVYRRSRGRWRRVAQLTSPRPEAQLAFAEGAAVSADGKTALIAAAARSESSGARPIAYIFTRMNDDVWTSSGALIMNRPWLAALSADGSTILAPPDLHEVAERVEGGGPAQVFTRAGSGWQEVAALTPRDATGVDSRSFGYDFALSSDGTTALVSEGPDVAWVFSRTGQSWAREAKLQLEGATGGGAHVALSADGNTAVLAGPSAAGPVAAWTFTRTGGSWSSQAAPIIASGAGPRPPGSLQEMESFASSVAVSANGDVILVGADWDSGWKGAAWIFTRSGTGWTQQGAKLTPSGVSPEERFGSSAALSASGDVALIGGVGDRQHPPEGPPPEGAAYAFTRSGATWTQTAKLIDGERNPYENHTGLGSAVALSADGATALLGAYDHAIVFTRSASDWRQHEPPLKPYDFSNYAVFGGPPAFGDVIALSADGTTAVIGGLPEDGCGRYDNEPCSDKSAMWAFGRRGEAWVRQPLPLIRDRSFGEHVALSGTGQTALIRGVTPGSEPGGAVFASELTPPPQTGFIVEPATVEYLGVIEQRVWRATFATYTAAARLLSPRDGAPIVRRRCSHPTQGRAAKRCSSGSSPLYGMAIAKGAENVTLTIAPSRAMRRYLARHKRVRLAITIRCQPGPPEPASTQMIMLTVTYRKPPPPEF
ncbi:MAG: hypothetical protein E6G34_13600 [Actinobacteria bacterium]|nr:MAG: hypothetical protein E6G34_13600 [Actinomycetota bacterium]